MRALALLASLACLPAHAGTTLADPYPDVAAAHYIEVDGRPLWGHAPDRRLPMASLTKLMTALVIAEEADLATIVTVSRNAAAETGSRLGLRVGEQIPADALFNAMLVRSANDACRALADWHGGDEPAFVERMNTRAASLGLSNTRFTNACGHDGPGHYASARDLATLAHAAMREAVISKAVAMPSFAFTSLDGRRYDMRNTNALLGSFDGTLGIKTGSTPLAGRCLIVLVERDGVRVLAVLLHAPERWWDSVGLLELALAHVHEHS